MPSRITFASERGKSPLGLKIEEDVEDVLAAWKAAKGLPFPLTNHRGERIYVNPATVAYWQPVK
jgi:hypothetical protein